MDIKGKTGIHLINKSRRALTRVGGTSDIYDSGDWAVAPATASALVGGELFLHETQTGRSYYGGTILAWYPKTGEDNRQRVVFRFRHSIDHQGVIAGPGGWAQEKKLANMPAR